MWVQTASLFEAALEMQTYRRGRFHKILGETVSCQPRGSLPVTRDPMTITIMSQSLYPSFPIEGTGSARTGRVLIVAKM